ncbi:hypothetical protein KAU33_05565 [Candidatus Dependentiae bacterium]|nr:hypothetical protein [Candidatus Dependentiae bacterium]
MKKRYLLWSVFFVIASVLIFSFLNNGCSNTKSTNISQVKNEKKLKYPEWPGLDEKIEKYNKLVEGSPPELNATSLFKMGVEKEDIKWHFVIYLDLDLSENEIQNVIEEINKKGGKIYKNIQNRSLYITILSMERFKDYYNYLNSLKKTDKRIRYFYMNDLIEYSCYHYSPIDNTTHIIFNEILSDEEKKVFAKKYNLKFKEGNYFKFNPGRDFIKAYVKMFEDPLVKRVALNDLYAIKSLQIQEPVDTDFKNKLQWSLKSKNDKEQKDEIKDNGDLKYPEWPGLDEKIEEYEEVIKGGKKVYSKDYTNLARLKIEPEDIKWHLCIYVIGIRGSDKYLFKKEYYFPIEIDNLIKRIAKENNCEIHKISKIYGSRKYYITIKNYKKEELRRYYDLFKIHKEMIEIKTDYPKRIRTIKLPLIGRVRVYVNSLIEFSIGHHRPIDITEIPIRFYDNVTEEKIKQFMKKYNIKRYKKKTLGKNRYAVYYKGKDEDFVKFYVSIQEDPIVNYVSLYGWAKVKSCSDQYYYKQWYLAQ